MSFAIYGESDTYVHLVAAESREKAVKLFKEDVESVGVRMSHLFNVYASEGRSEDIETENFINEMIEWDKKGILNKED